MSSGSSSPSAVTPAESSPPGSEGEWDIILTTDMPSLSLGPDGFKDFLDFEQDVLWLFGTDPSFLGPEFLFPFDDDAESFALPEGFDLSHCEGEPQAGGSSTSEGATSDSTPNEGFFTNSLKLCDLAKAKVSDFPARVPESDSSPSGPRSSSSGPSPPGARQLHEPRLNLGVAGASGIARVTELTRHRQRSPSPANIWEKVAGSTSCFQIDMQQPVAERLTKKVRGVLSAFERTKVQEVRRKKACLRCHLQKLSCDGNTPCGQCVRVQGKTRLYRSVCERLKIEDAFRKGNSKFNQEDAFVRPYPIWASGKPPRVMTLIRPRHASTRWPRGDDCPNLTIQVQEFTPGPTDITTERWRSGLNEVILELPAYAAADNEEVTAALLRWVDDNFEYYARDMVSQPGDFIIGATFDEALRYAAKYPVRVPNPHPFCSSTPRSNTVQDSIVKIALKIWVGVRMAQEFFSVVEDNDFGIEVVQDLNSIHNGQCPIPPVLDHQLDVLMIVEMAKMNAVLLKRYKKVIESRNRHNWFELYLTSFVLLSNLQYVYRSQERWWKMHFHTGKDNAIGKAYRSISYRFMQRYRFSANNIISHFRYCLKGPVPFTLDWDQEKQGKLGNIDSDAVKYVKYISVNVRRRTPEFQENFARTEQGEFEGDMFWLSQLFLDVGPSSEGA
ncbi:hypothetical protein F5144DRAFT_125099 [Chaetomium tenue]|uniref:Uncharacterized protein n=1 Tax=Chaetomium tenue TaxID=1854479 RepID=A0ACB7PN53_9PEZI|nr:hypothetical protein F5144DRAFT_125099 [Chaetomium globosum]